MTVGTALATFKRILAGTDGSDTSRLAIAHAAHLARCLEAELTVLSAHAGPDGRALETAGATGEIARALLRDVEAQYRDGLDLRTLAVEGHPAAALVEVSIRGSFDLVVVGNRGIRGARGPQRGIPERIAHRSRAAVLIVDTMRGRAPGYEQVLAGADGSSTSMRAVEAAHAISEACGGDLTIATAASSEPVGQAILAPLRARWPRASTAVVEGPPSAGLCKLAESGGYDLLVVGSKGATRSRRFVGSVPDRITARAPTSVLIVNAS